MAKKGSKKEEPKGPATILNRRASFDYKILDTVEAGVVLIGSEVKSVFLGNANLTDAYCRIVNSEAWLYNADIEPYAYSSHFQPERRRDRKLLLKRKEIEMLENKIQERGLALIPLRIYFNDRGRAKVLIGFGEGKKNYDKREAVAERETKRQQQRIQRGARDE